MNGKLQMGRHSSNTTSTGDGGPNNNNNNNNNKTHSLTVETSSLERHDIALSRDDSPVFSMLE
jgi:hypothetical protein